MSFNLIYSPFIAMYPISVILLIFTCQCQAEQDPTLLNNQRSSDFNTETDILHQQSELKAAIALDKKMSGVTSYHSYLELMKTEMYRKTSYKLHSSNQPRFGSPINMAMPAICLPSPQTVEVKVGNMTSSTIVFPACTRLERCGGCCSHPLLECLPTKVKMVERSVTVIELDRQTDRQEVINLTNHLECGCQCRTQPDDCNIRQHYLPSQCRCECSNRLDRGRCQDLTDKVWDSVSCNCVCRDVTSCTTGYTYSKNSCRCEKPSENQIGTSRPPSTGSSRLQRSRGRGILG